MEMALTRHEARRALKKRSAGALPHVLLSPMRRKSSPGTY
jgi:hypothetical protein